MRKFVGFLLLLFAATFVAAQDPKTDTQLNAVLKPDQEKDLAKIFEKAQSRLEEDRSSMDSIIVRHPGSLATVDIGYFAEEVTDKFESVRNKLIKSLDDKRYEGIRNQIAVSYPVPELCFLAIRDSRIVVSQKSVDKGYKQISDYITEMQGVVGSPLISIQINVNGGEKAFATFQLGSEPGNRRIGSHAEHFTKELL